MILKIWKEQSSFDSMNWCLRKFLQLFYLPFLSIHWKNDGVIRMIWQWPWHWMCYELLFIKSRTILVHLMEIDFACSLLVVHLLRLKCSQMDFFFHFCCCRMIKEIKCQAPNLCRFIWFFLNKKINKIIRFQVMIKWIYFSFLLLRLSCAMCKQIHLNRYYVDIFVERAKVQYA